MSFKKCVAASSAVLSILVSGAECVPLKPEVRNLLGITSPEKDPQSFWFNKQLPADFFEKSPGLPHKYCKNPLTFHLRNAIIDVPRAEVLFSCEKISSAYEGGTRR